MSPTLLLSTDCIQEIHIFYISHPFGLYWSKVMVLKVQCEICCLIYAFYIGKILIY